MHSLPGHSSPEGLQHQVIGLLVSRSPGAIGDVSRDLWERLSQRLVALIGQEGFKALFERSLHLAGTRFAWLARTDASSDPSARFQALSTALQARDPDESRQAAVLLLSTFTGLLSTLIGHNLTTNILRTAWGGAFEEAVQEVSQWSTK